MHWSLPNDIQVEKKPTIFFLVILPDTTNVSMFLDLKKGLKEMLWVKKIFCLTWKEHMFGFLPVTQSLPELPAPKFANS